MGQEEKEIGRVCMRNAGEKEMRQEVRGGGSDVGH